MRGKTVEVRCQRCKDPFIARIADRKRGWGKFCSKSCKAIKQTYGRDCFRSEKNDFERDMDNSCASGTDSDMGGWF